MTPADHLATALLRRLPGDVAVCAVRRGGATLVGVEPAAIVAADAAEGLAALDHLGPGFWVGWCAFELGHAVEPRARGAGGIAADEPARVPDVVFARFDTHVAIAPDGRAITTGAGPGRALLDDALPRATADPHPEPTDPPGGAAPSWRSSLGRADFEARVHAVRDLLVAGECYQVNLTRRLECDEAIDPIALHRAISRSHRAPYTTLLRLDLGGEPVAVVSASPEQFLRRTGPTVSTRPIKGTAADAAALRASAKDHAENVMIVDLARNDLGRVCVPGTIRVPELCGVEAHPGLHHLVSTVEGELRADVGIGELVRATFPPASVTGAPKPRVLRAIDELEPVRRGIYCGALGWIDTRDDTADLAVAIRTFTVLGRGAAGTTHLGVGSGIVADSQPAAEWDETELKGARLLELAATAASHLPEPVLAAVPAP